MKHNQEQLEVQLASTEASKVKFEMLIRLVVGRKDNHCYFNKTDLTKIQNVSRCCIYGSR